MPNPGSDVDWFAKIRVRESLAEKLPLGPGEKVFVPFCGKGEIYGPVHKHWPPDSVFAVDRDLSMVNAFKEKWPDAEVQEGIAERVEFGDRGPFRVADFDTDTYPMEAFMHFMESAKKAKGKIGIVTSTGSLRHLLVRGQVFNFDRMKPGRFDKESTKKQVAEWGSVLAGWMRGLEGIESVEVVDSHQAKNSIKHTFSAYIVTFATRKQVAPGIEIDLDAEQVAKKFQKRYYQQVSKIIKDIKDCGYEPDKIDRYAIREMAYVTVRLSDVRKALAATNLYIKPSSRVKYLTEQEHQLSRRLAQIQAQAGVTRQAKADLQRKEVSAVRVTHARRAMQRKVGRKSVDKIEFDPENRLKPSNDGP